MKASFWLETSEVQFRLRFRQAWSNRSRILPGDGPFKFPRDFLDSFVGKKRLICLIQK